MTAVAEAPVQDAPPAPQVPGDDDGRRDVVGLAAASIVANGLALVFTVVFARALGTDGYGSLAVLLSALMILSVAGTALQVAVARDVAAGRYGTGPALAATVRGWLAPLIAGAAVLAVVSVAAQSGIAALLNVDETWAAAVVLPGACLWLMLCLLRGVLQGIGRITPVAISIAGEAFGRLVVGLALLALGTGVTGAFLGTPLSFAIAGAALAVILHRRLGPAADEPPGEVSGLIRSAWTAVFTLTLIMILQNIDVLVVKHRFDEDSAGAYAAVAVAAKVLIWVAIGVTGYVVPEAARRAARGAAPIGALRQALALIVLLGVPVLLIYAFAAEPLLRIGFGEEYAEAHAALLPLGTAMTLLACCYLAAQYLVALHHTTFIPILLVAAVVEVVALSVAGDGYVSVAVIVLVVQAVAMAGILVLASRAQPRGRIEPLPV